MILLIDNFDSFTYNLVDYFHQLGEKVLVVRNNISPSQIEWSPISKVVLSPGPESPEKANFLMTILNECISRNLPCLGVCLGHQAINIHFGGNLKKGIRPMHGKVSHITHNSTKLFHEIPSPLRVVRYHSLEIDNLGNELEIISLGPNEEIMAIKHKSKEIYGIQFHPESILTDFGLKILSNWLKISG